MTRKILSLNEKCQILQQRPYCFICEEPVSEENMTELNFDHIRALDAGGSNDLTNFAGVHKKCHRGKGTKSLEDYKEELRLDKEFGSLLRFTDVTKRLNPAKEKILKKFLLNGKKLLQNDIQLTKKINVMIAEKRKGLTNKENAAEKEAELFNEIATLEKERDFYQGKVKKQETVIKSTEEAVKKMEAERDEAIKTADEAINLKKDDKPEAIKS